MNLDICKAHVTELSQSVKQKDGSLQTSIHRSSDHALQLSTGGVSMSHHQHPLQSSEPSTTHKTFNGVPKFNKCINIDYENTF